MDGEKLIIAVDVPSWASAEDAERIFNQPYSRGYYVLSIGQRADGSARGFFKKSRDPEQNPKDEEALAIIRAHPRDSVTHLLARFKAAALKRSHNWISQQRTLLKVERGEVRLGK